MIIFYDEKKNILLIVVLKIMNMAMHRTVLAAVVAALLLAPSTTDAFTSPYASTKTGNRATPVSTTAISTLPTEILHDALHSASTFLSDDVVDVVLSPEVAGARQKFWFYFFAGSGAGGIGISQLPAIFRDASSARAVAGTGPTLGGEALNAGPLLGVYYDNEISAKDVSQAIQKAPTSEFISKRSQSINYMASKGYIDRRDFIREMEGKGCNPLASYAVYDAISAGKGDLVNPEVFDEKLAVYRAGSAAGEVAGTFAGDLNGFLAVKVGAFLGLLFCLFIDVGFIANAYIAGFQS